MRRFVDIREDTDEINYWIPVSNILAAFMLVLMIVLVAGFIYIRNMPQNGPKQQEQQSAGNVDEKYLAELEAKEARLNTLSEAFQQYSGIRDAIVGELSEKFSSLKINADIDRETGSVRFGEAVLFDVNSVNLKPEGEEYLKKLMPAYLSVVMSGKYSEYIDQIIVEGHADDGGTYLYNLALSQNRSYSVVGYLISSKLTKLEDGTDIEKLLSISGKSYSKPVKVNGTVDRNQSRRVELVFMLKYDRLMNQMQDLMEGGEE